MVEMMTPEQAIDQLVHTIHSQDKELMFGNIITVDLRTLPSYARYSELKEWIFCNRWRVYLKRFFLSKKYKRYTQEYLQVQLSLQQEFIDAVMKMAEAKEG